LQINLNLAAADISVFRPFVFLVKRVLVDELVEAAGQCIFVLQDLLTWHFHLFVMLLGDAQVFDLHEVQSFACRLSWLSQLSRLSVHPLEVENATFQVLFLDLELSMD